MTELRNVILVVWLALGLCACSNPEADRALIEAAKGGNLEQVNLAISDWGNVNAKGGKLMATPLHYATVHGHTPVVERLLDKGADVGLTDANGKRRFTMPPRSGALTWQGCCWLTRRM